MRLIETSVDIKAPADKVWKHLTDFEKFPEWNPFIKKVEGQAQAGTKLTIHLCLEADKINVFKPQVLEVKENKKLAWLGSLGIPGLFDGQHTFELHSTPEGHTRLMHYETFKGILAGMVLASIGDKKKNAFNQMNEKLKERAEQQ